MKQICVNDVKSDVCAFVPGLSTDLAKALESGQVVGGDVSPSFNGISDPSEVIGRVRDSFDAVDASTRLAAVAAAQSTPPGASE